MTKNLKTDFVDIATFFLTRFEALVHQTIVGGTLSEREGVDTPFARHIILEHIVRMEAHLAFIHQV